MAASKVARETPSFCASGQVDCRKDWKAGSARAGSAKKQITKKANANRIRRSGLAQLEPPLDSVDARVQAVHAIGQIRILAFEDSEPAFSLAHVIANAIDGTANMAQMFNEAFGVGHGDSVSYSSAAPNSVTKIRSSPRRRGPRAKKHWIP